MILGFDFADDKKIARELLRENAATFPTILDSSQAATLVGCHDYKRTGVPLNYILDARHQVVDAGYGYEQGHQRALAALKKAGLKLDE
ncbi:MAG: hypothetical protein MUC88_26555 [Planctomycetes bacterium]|nr:hypothetical protein [Planctomycetota bacterium]